MVEYLGNLTPALIINVKIALIKADLSLENGDFLAAARFVKIAIELIEKGSIAPESRSSK